MRPWELPESATIGGAEFAIRSDYRVALDILALMEDAETDDRDRAEAALVALFPDYDGIPPESRREAADFLRWFLAGGEMRAGAPKRKLADWEQDFPIIAGPVNRVLGFDVRGCGHLHWWTFLAAYLEVGDCLFAQVVAIRKKRQKGRKLSDREREFYRENRDLVEFARRETEAEAAALEEWIS